MTKSDLVDERSLDGGEEYIEVWNDLVSPQHLTWSLVSCGGTVVVSLVIATALSSSLFLWGLGGAVLGFIISAVLFTPKRVVQIVENDDSEPLLSDTPELRNNPAEGAR